MKKVDEHATGYSKRSVKELMAENAELRLRLDEAEKTLRTIREIEPDRGFIEEHKEQRELLRISERRLSYAFSGSSGSLWEWNLVTNETYYSAQWYEMLGYGNNDFSMNFDSWKNLCHPEDFHAVVDQIQNILHIKQENGYEVEFRMKHKNGEWVWILGRGNVVERNAHGIPLLVSGTNIDITKRKRIEEAFHESEQRLMFHFENSALAVVEWDANFVVTKWSCEAERIFGWKKEEILGKRIDSLNIIYAEDIPIVDRTMERLMSGNERTVVSTNRNVTKTGAVIECTWYNSILLDAKGRLLSVMSLVQDITVQKRTDEKLHIALQRLYLILSSIQHGILLVTDDDRVEFATQDFCNIFGFKESPGELTGMSAAEMLEKIRPAYQDPGAAIARIKEIVDHGQPVKGEDVGMCSERTFLRDFIPIRFGEKEFGRLWNHIDITERKKSEIELRRLYEQTERDAIAKTGLLNEVNHRVKNNLIMILGLILAEKRRTVTDEHVDVNAVWENFERRINGLLSVHQMLSDSHWEPIRLARLAERICTGVMNRGVQSKQQAVSLRVEHSDIEVSPRQAANLALVFNELITNCLKHAFTGCEHPSVSIISRMDNELLHIEFKDNGSGYPDEILMEKGWNVGLQLIRQLIEHTLDGEMLLLNNNGAATLLYLGIEECHRT
jgi:PAS domain S-box-containing protein